MPLPFPPTSWSVVYTLKATDPEAARRAMSVLCEVYWPPLYAFVRRRGVPPEEAKDLTQEFFLHLLQRDTLAKADESKGRFRSFLLASFRNFLANERARAGAQKRSPRRPIFSLDHEDAEKWYQLELADHLTPEDIYDRRWAQIVAGRAWQRLEVDQKKSSNEQRFRRLEGYIIGDDSSGPYGQVAGELGITVGAVKTAVHRLRKEFGKWLQIEVGATVADPAQMDDEIRHILHLIESSGTGLPGSGGPLAEMG